MFESVRQELRGPARFGAGGGGEAEARGFRRGRVEREHAAGDGSERLAALPIHDAGPHPGRRQRRPKMEAFGLVPGARSPVV